MKTINEIEKIYKYLVKRYNIKEDEEGFLFTDKKFIGCINFRPNCDNYKINRIKYAKEFPSFIGSRFSYYNDMLDKWIKNILKNIRGK